MMLTTLHRAWIKRVTRMHIHIQALVLKLLKNQASLDYNKKLLTVTEIQIVT